MTYKQRTFDACRKIIDKYENPTREHDYFRHLCCPLCKLYYRWGVCRGCFMANDNGLIGCNEFRSSWRAHRDYNDGDIFEVTNSFRLRAQFFREMLVELEAYPDRQFTPSGWQYFDIDRGR